MQLPVQMSAAFAVVALVPVGSEHSDSSDVADVESVVAYIHLLHYLALRSPVAVALEQFSVAVVYSAERMPVVAEQIG